MTFRRSFRFPEHTRASKEGGKTQTKSPGQRGGVNGTCLRWARQGDRGSLDAPPLMAITCR